MSLLWRVSAAVGQGAYVERRMHKAALMSFTNTDTRSGAVDLIDAAKKADAPAKAGWLGAGHSKLGGLQ